MDMALNDGKDKYEWYICNLIIMYHCNGKKQFLAISKCKGLNVDEKKEKYFAYLKAEFKFDMIML